MITTPEQAYEARLKVAVHRVEQRAAKQVMAYAEAQATLAFDGKNADDRAAQVSLRLGADPFYNDAHDAYEAATVAIAQIEAALDYYAEYRADLGRDLRERELAAREVQP